MSMIKVGKLEVLTKFDKTADGKLTFDGKIFTSVTVTEIDRGYRITVTDAEHPNGEAYDIVDNGLILVSTVAELDAIADIEDCLILVPHDLVGDGTTFYAGLLQKIGETITQVSRFASTEDVANWNDANAKKHAHKNPVVLAKLGEDTNGNATYDGKPLAFADSDPLVPLALGTTYPSLSVRSDWSAVPVYVTGESEVVARLSSDDTSESGFAVSEIRLFYLQDFSTGMPCPVLRVSAGGHVYENYSVLFHDRDQNRAAGWYEVTDDYHYLGTDAPTLSAMRFDKLILSSTEVYTDLTSLPDKARCALDTLSRMVNVSADAMGTLGVIEDGVQRLTHVPQNGKRYAYASARDITFPLPAIVWSDKPQEFWLDLDCTSTINLTFSETVCYEDGGNVDTTRGKHRLHFYTAANSDKWTVAETESYEEVTEDYLPEYVIPFKYCTADQIRAVLKLGYSDGNGNWCVRRKGGIIQTWFSIGDTHPVTLTDGQEVNMRIIGIEHDDLLNGGKAALTCDFKEVVAIEPTVYPAIKATEYAYMNNPMRERILNIETIFPLWLSDFLTPAKHYLTDEIYVPDKICILSAQEVGFTESTSFSSVYPIFTDNASRIRYTTNDKSPQFWILRTRSPAGSTSWYMYHHGVTISGGENMQIDPSTEISSMAVCFCLHVD